MTEATAIDIRGIPDDIRIAVVADARARDVSVNDAVTECLAARYGLPWEASGYPYTVTADAGDHWNFRVSVQLRDTLRAHAGAVGGTITGCVLLALSDRYALPPHSTRRRVPGIDPQIVAEARRLHREEGVSLRKLSKRYGVKRETLTKAIRSG